MDEVSPFLGGKKKENHIEVDHIEVALLLDLYASQAGSDGKKQDI